MDEIYEIPDFIKQINAIMPDPEPTEKLTLDQFRMDTYYYQINNLDRLNEKDRFIKPNIIRELFAIIVEMYIDLSQKTINLSVEETRDMIYQELVNKKLLLPDIIQKLQKFDTLTIIQ